MSSNTIAVTDETFAAQVLASETPVLVKFEADWCGPCQAMKPVVEEIANEYGERLRVATIDIDRNTQTPYRFGVRGIPTMLLFRNGEVIAQQVGTARKAQLDSLLASKLAA